MSFDVNVYNSGFIAIMDPVRWGEQTYLSRKTYYFLRVLACSWIVYLVRTTWDEIEKEVICNLSK